MVCDGNGPAWVAVLEAAVGERVEARRSATGGGIADASAVRLASGRRCFVKRRDGAPPDMFTTEAQGLQWLAVADALPTPTVLAALGPPHPMLVLEHIDSGPRAPDFDERLGRGLARLHRHHPAGFGLDHDNYVGAIAQRNRPEGDWPTFYREQRILPLVRRTRDEGTLPARLGRALEDLAARFESRCGPAEPPARLHGDLWAGNCIASAAGEPILIDPAAYAGHREIDLAMMMLFGGYGPPVFAAYDEAYPLAPGWRERIPLYQLYPLLVHVALFGSGYVAQLADATARSR